MPEPPSRLFDEARTRRAIVRLRRGGTEQVAGTGFFVGPRSLLTCYHVVAMAGGAVDVELPPDGPPVTPPRVVAAEVVTDPEAFRRDMAVLRIVDPQSPAMEPLACGGPCETGRTVWSTGFQRPIPVLRDSLPTTAVIGGATTIRASWLDQADLDVFTLTNAVVGPGLSGAPVVDLKTGAVIALVDAAQTSAEADPIAGFAVSLFPPPQVGPLADLLQANRNEVPAYGRHLNRAGASVLCRKLAEASLRELTGDFRLGSIYDPQTYTPRDVEQQVEAFLESSQQLLPILGATGVGKTNLLARVASQTMESRAVLLTRAMHFNPSVGDGLAAVLEHALGSTEPAAFPGLGRLFTELDPVAPVILVDGLNEASFASLTQARSWVTRTVAWLRTHDVRLVVSSRPQFWTGISDLIPDDLCFKAEDSERDKVDRVRRTPSDGITVGDFAPDEHQQATEKYGLAAPPPAGIDLGRHPFFLRVWAEVNDPAGLDPADQAWTGYQALDRYLKQISRRTSVATDQAYTVDDVHAVLSGLGAEAFQARANILARAAIDNRFRSDRPLRNALLDLRILEAAGSGFRFGFDAVAEFLMGEAIDDALILAEGADWILGIRRHEPGEEETTEGRDSLVGSMTQAVIRREHAGNHPIVRQVIEKILSHPKASADFLASALLHLLAELRVPERYAAQLRAAVGRVVSSKNFSSSSVVEGLALLASRGRVSSALILELIRPWFLQEDPYPFEWGHWLDQGHDQFDHEMLKSWNDTPGSTVYQLFATRPADEVVHALLPWLVDQTKLKQTTGSVGIEDVAAALLYRHRKQVFESLCEALFRQDSPTHLTNRLLAEVLSHDLDGAVMLLERWADATVPGRDLLLLQLTSLALGKALPEHAERFQGVLDRVASRTPPGSPNFAALVEASTQCPGRRGTAWDTLDKLPDGWPRIEVAWLNRYAEDRPEAVLAVVDRCLETGATNLQREVLDLFGEFAEKPHLVAAALSRIARLIAIPNPLVAYKVGWTLETLLRTVPTNSPGRADLVDLTLEAIGQGGPDVHRSMIYYTLFRWADGQPESADARRLWDKLRATALGEEARGLIFEKLIEKCRTFTEVLASLDPFRVRMPAADFEEELVRALRWKRLPHHYFQTWLEQPDPPREAERFRLLRALFLKGLEAEVAIEQAAALH